MRFFLLLAAVIFGWMLPLSLNGAQPQSETPIWRLERIALEREFGIELQEIVNWCRQNGFEQQIEQTLKLYRDRDPGRQYIYLPDDRSMPTRTDDVFGEWLAKINAAKVAHADRIFELAKRASDQDAGATAFQLLHEVVFYNKDHADVRKMLGHVKGDAGWRVAPESVRVKPGTKPHDLINWPAGSYIRVLSPHFEIESNASEERARYLAELLEQTHTVWRQVFFEYWSSSAAVKRWIQGKGSARMGRKRFRIIFFRSRDSYLAQLKPSIRGIEISTGYYSSDHRASYFYDGNEREEDTWRHELTHQLFRESGSANKRAFEDQFIWLDEGIATYFESLTDYGDYVTLGGFEARRMQFARIRRLLEDFHVPLKDLSAIGRIDLQQRADMVRLYTEAAGMTDMLMNDEYGAYEESLTEFLRLIYKGRVKTGSFEKIIGKSFEELDARYKAYLQVTSEMIEQYLALPEMRTELSVPGANLKTAAYDSIGRCHALTWLDLSRNSITADQFTKLKSCQQLNQLILTQCRFEEDSLRGLEFFPRLDDVDLSGSSVQDLQLASFKNLKSLKSLRLTATAITDTGLAYLADVPGLLFLNVSQTEVTDQGVAKLKSRLPNLTVTQ